MARAEKLLEDYEAKRHFDRTPEPPPAVAGTAGSSLAFVVQKHAARQLHYDFRLELDGVLKSWAVPKGPSLDPSVKRLAVMVEDHPIDYAGFEGAIPKGEYGAGHVIVWDAGTYSPDEAGKLSFDDRAASTERTRVGLAKGKLSITIRGEKMRGSWTLVKSRRGENQWLLIKHDDAFADSTADLLAEDRSTVSGQTVEDLKLNPNGNVWTGSAPPGPVSEEPSVTVPAFDLATTPKARMASFPTALAPMLPSLAAAPFTDANWIFEPKLDGVRALALVKNGRARLLARSGIETTAQYPGLVADLKGRFESDLVLDGEIVTFDEDGRPSFHRLAHRMHLRAEVDIRRAEAEIPAVYYAFDLLYLDGFDLRAVPIEERKRILQRVFEQTSPVGRIWLLPHFEADGEIAFRAAVDHGFEGVVAKRRGSTYETGRRSPRWLKIKGTTTDDFVIGGYSRGQGNRAGTFGALLIGNMGPDGRLVYAAHVGTGFDDGSLRDTLASLEGLQSELCPFTEVPPLKGPTTWVRPELVAEVKFDQWTPDGKLRAPVFMRLRPDKAPEETARSVVVSHPGAQDDAGVIKAGDLELETGLAGVDSSSGRAGACPPPPGEEVAEPGGGGQAPALPERRNSGTSGVEGVLEQLAQPAKKLLLEVDGCSIGLTNLDKALWPATDTERALTKRDLISYYATASPYLLDHLRDRPLTLIRLPNGILGQRFYQKHGEVLPDFVETVRHFSKHVEGDQDYLLCNNLPTLLWLGQVAAIELHSSYCRISPEPDAQHLSKAFAGSREGYLRSLLNFPDFIVFDLDPYIYSGHEAKGDEPELNRQAFSKTCDTALWLKEILDSLSLRSFLKTTGRTGLHIFVPIRRDLDSDATRSFAESIVTHLARAHPTDVTIEWSVSRRTGKVFADYNQNARAKTLAAIYSPRASAQASVSTPLAWDELGHVYPTDFTILSLPRRLDRLGDLWAGILDAKHDLKALVGAP